MAKRSLEVALSVLGDIVVTTTNATLDRLLFVSLVAPWETIEWGKKSG
jgi:hypothetical protein